MAYTSAGMPNHEMLLPVNCIVYALIWSEKANRPVHCGPRGRMG